MTTNNQSGGDGLLPCPFCGGEAEYSHNKTFESHYYQCSNSLCPVNPALQVSSVSKEEAKAAWNTRRPAKPMDARDVVDDRVAEAIKKASHPGHRINLLMHEEDKWILETLIRAAQSKPSATKVMTEKELKKLISDIWNNTMLAQIKAEQQINAMDVIAAIICELRYAKVIQVRED